VFKTAGKQPNQAAEQPDELLTIFAPYPATEGYLHGPATAALPTVAVADAFR